MLRSTGKLVAAAASSIPADGRARCSGCKLYPRRRDPSLQRLQALSPPTGSLVAAAACSIPADGNTRCSGCKLDPRRPEDSLQRLQARSPPPGGLVAAAASSIPAEGNPCCSRCKLDPRRREGSLQPFMYRLLHVRGFSLPARRAGASHVPTQRITCAADEVRERGVRPNDVCYVLRRLQKAGITWPCSPERLPLVKYDPTWKLESY